MRAPDAPDLMFIQATLQTIESAFHLYIVSFFFFTLPLASKPQKRYELDTFQIPVHQRHWAKIPLTVIQLSSGIE